MKSQPVYLGLSDSHDSGVALIAGGKILTAVNEERLSRKKMASGFPQMALQSALRTAGINAREITKVGLAGLSSAGRNVPINNDFSTDDGNYLASQRAAEWIDWVPGGQRLMSSDVTFSAYRAMMDLKAASRVKATREELSTHGIVAPVVAYDHHTVHLAAAYFASGMKDALVISNDGFGDGICSKVAIGNSQTCRLEEISQNSFFNSLGSYYNFATLLCGFRKFHHAGKTTGLAAFGDPKRTLPLFRRMIGWDESLGRYVNHGGVFRNCLTRLRDELTGVSREDIAAGIQRHSEDVLVAMVRHYVRLTGRRKVVLVGGVHANVKVNQRIAELTEIERLFVFPNMGDGGLGLGAAYLAAADAGELREMGEQIGNVYLGPEYGEQELLKAISDFQLAFTRPDRISLEVARMLKAGKVVARFDGAMEYGPRALGNRSILYSAERSEVNKWLNKQLNRTEFMPFAPAMRAEDAEHFLVDLTPKTADAAKFMTITYDVTEQCKREAPATVHIDGTARPQLIHRTDNPDYYDIFTEYNRLTGLSILVNTSFNMHEEPIVCSPADAIRAFLDSNIDFLALGPFLLAAPQKH